jgi:tryptophan-rich sensory protein
VKWRGRTDLIGLGVALGLCFGASALGGLATQSSVGSWYLTLDKPPWNPPGWVFGPVWALLYAAMAVAAWLVWRHGREARPALVLFGGQLVLNVLWSFLFFQWRQPGYAAIEIFVLLLAIGGTATSFRRLSKPAFWLMVPYGLWVAFASTLNLAIWHLNP